MEMMFLAILERGPESFGMFSPDIPGCVAAALCAEDVRMLYRSAAESHIADLFAHGDSLPTPSGSERAAAIVAESPEGLTLEWVAVLMPAGSIPRS